MKIFTIKCLLLFTLLLSPVSLLDAQTMAERLNQLMKEYNSNEIFNGSILIADSSGIILEKGYGFANLDENIENTAQTQFRIGSVTKQFVATVIMQLAEEGKIDLSDPITKYLPEYRKDTGDSVTIHQLLNHTSGITSYTNIPGWWRDSTKYRFSKDHMIKYAHSGDLEFPPGTDYSYNNTGYYLLGVIAERVSGVPYELLLRQRIFDPAGMNRTGVEREEFPPPNLAQGYLRNGLSFVKDDYFYMPNALGAGDVYSTVGDLYKWDRALYTDEYLSSVSKQRMWTPYLNEYGYGWVITKVPNTDTLEKSTLIFHTGGINGFNTMFARLVDEDKTVIFVNNTGPTSLFNMLRNIVLVMDGKEPLKVRKPFLPELERLILAKGNEEAVEFFKENKDSIKSEYILDESAINLRGYQVLEEEINTDKAIAIFKINIEAFPESFNVYDSMGEAYMKKGDNQKAIEFYNKSLSINPGNSNAIEMLKKLGEDIDTPQEIKLKNEDLVKYEGRYQLAPNFFIEITVSEDRIFEQASGQAKYEIFPITEIDFILKIVDAKIKFLVSETGIVKGLTLFQNNQSMVGEKVD
jgi:CubicO group peptidase (beta-lactamase class C family)